MRYTKLWRLATRLCSPAGQHGYSPEDLPTADENYNWKMLRLETPWGGLAFGSAYGFFALLAIQLGASNAQVGWLTSGPSMLQLVWLLPCGWLVQRARSYIHILNGSIIVHRLTLIAIAGIPFLPSAWRPVALILLATLSALPAGAWSIAWQAAAGDLFRPRVFPRLVGQIWAMANLSQVAWMLSLGWLVDAIRFPVNFQSIYLGIGLATLFPIWVMARLRLPPRSPTANALKTPRLSLAMLGTEMRQQRPLLLFQLGVFVGYAAFFGAAPLLRIYWVRELGAAGGWVGALTACFLLGATLGNLFWGRRARPHNMRIISLITMCGSMASYALLTASFRSLPPLAAVGIWAGFFDGGIGLMFLNRLFQIAPPRHRPTFVAIHTLTINLAAFLAPLASTALADIAGVRLALSLAGGLGLAGALLVYLLGWRNEARPSRASDARDYEA